MSVLQNLDCRSVEVVEKICHKIQRLTGMSNYRLAVYQLLILLILLLDIRTNIIFPKEIMAGGMYATMHVQIPYFYWIMVFGTFCDAFFTAIREGDAFERVKCGNANPLKIKNVYVSLRIGNSLMFLSMGSFYLMSIWITLYDMFIIGSFVIVGLLQACDPLPPSKGMIREWIGSFRSSLMGRIVPQPIRTRQ